MAKADAAAERVASSAAIQRSVPARR